MHSGAQVGGLDADLGRRRNPRPYSPALVEALSRRFVERPPLVAANRVARPAAAAGAARGARPGDRRAGGVPEGRRRGGRGAAALARQGDRRALGQPRGGGRLPAASPGVGRGRPGAARGLRGRGGSAHHRRGGGLAGVAGGARRRGCSHRRSLSSCSFVTSLLVGSPLDCVLYPGRRSGRLGMTRSFQAPSREVNGSSAC